MKKIFFFAFLAISNLQAQITLVDVGTAPNMGDGDPLRTSFQKVNASLTYLEGVTIGQLFDTVHFTNNEFFLTDKTTNEFHIGSGANYFIFGIMSGKKLIRNLDYIQFVPGTVPATPAEGQVYYRNSDDKLLVRTASAWDTLNGGSGTGGGGEVGITGTPSTNQIAIWTDWNHIGSNIYFSYLYNDNFTADAGAGTILLAADDGINIYDSLKLNYLAGSVNGGPMFLLATPLSGAVDTGWMDPVYRGLTDPIWDVQKVLADTVNKEIGWYHIDDKTKELVKTYGLPGGMDNFEALQYTAEMSLRLIARQDSMITALEKRLNNLGKNRPQKEPDTKLYLGLILFLMILLILTLILRLK